MQMQNVIAALLKDGNIKKAIQIQFDNVQLEDMRNKYHQNTLGLQQNLYQIIEEERKEIQELQVIKKMAHFEVLCDIAPQNYQEIYEEETKKSLEKLPLVVKKIKKRVKIDLMRERFYLSRARNNLTAWLYEQIKPQANEEKQTGKGTGQVAKQKLKRDLQSITGNDKKAKQTQQDPLESKVTYSHILNVQSIIDMQQSFFPPRKTYPIKLYYPLKDNCCYESAILPPSNSLLHVRMMPKKLEGYESHLSLGSTYIIKIKNLVTFFQHITQKGSDFVYISNQMDMDYFQVKVLYDYVSKVFKLSKVHKEQRRRSLQKKDRVQVKMQEIKQHLRNIFKDYYEQQKIETIFSTEELYVSYGEIQQRVNSYFHPNSTDGDEVEESRQIEKQETNESKKEKEKEKDKEKEKEKDKEKDEDYVDEDYITKGRKRKVKQPPEIRANTRSNNQGNKMLSLI